MLHGDGAVALKITLDVVQGLFVLIGQNVVHTNFDFITYLFCRSEQGLMQHLREMGITRIAVSATKDFTFVPVS